MKVNLRHVAYGLCTSVPIVGPYLLGLREANRKHGVGATPSARYCYAVWLRHLIHVRRCGLRGIPETVAELGPGGSIGCGLAALLSGCARYYATGEGGEALRAVPARDQRVGLPAGHGGGTPPHHHTTKLQLDA